MVTQRKRPPSARVLKGNFSVEGKRCYDVKYEDGDLTVSPLGSLPVKRSLDSGLSQRCKCGHVRGAHVVDGCYPACRLCEACIAFRAV